MQPDVKSIRPFVGARSYKDSREFYALLGFDEVVIDQGMSLFRLGSFSFYLQDYYQKQWLNNSMIFLEVANLDAYHDQLASLSLPSRYKACRLSEIKSEDWGREFFLHDPAGVLWHIGEFTAS
ncbi:VOC family protein [Marinoscillum furvescens]|uniref:Catechol 2,3-dioxygenase-like lactoylglutathione lyase family enzyme n=1 Tax=Marinoscillum furvescens DSM 4134 TaxID=1122208 RepID=A0A3D9KWM8_MARFU|nr:glyoxalase [Marinoscillum furvescens]RED92803.1 hypothetical protein C7460_12820 [Marinoscillum furvescens DSM 4134]